MAAVAHELQGDWFGSWFWPHVEVILSKILNT